MWMRLDFTRSYKFLAFLVVLGDLLNFSYSCGANSYHRRRNRDKTPLQLKQRVPNVAEFSNAASGAPLGKIKHPRGKNSSLVPCYNTNVVFKDDEGTGADRLMSRRCKEKLNELAKLVKSDSEWAKQNPPIKLRVIEAWDEDNQHSKHSLHYEGRAVDITTSDKDESKYGKLGRLAYQAGFDWVYYADRRHIHASVKEDDASKRDDYRGCFSADSHVKLQSGRVVELKNLKVGDKVESMQEDGEVTFSDVLMFIDFQPLVPAVSHCVIETERAETQIVLTPTHLIFTLQNNKSHSELRAKHAVLVRVGEFVLVSSRGKLVPEKVSKVHLQKRTGMVAPLTRQGNIVVDGVLASCYAMTGDHVLAHWSFGPVRLWNSYAPKILDWDLVRQNGTHWYADFLMFLNRILGVTQLS